MLGSQYGVIYNEILAGANSSEHHIEDNSIEGMSASAILITNQSTVSGNMTNILIVGNEIGGAVGAAGITANAVGNRQWITTLLIASNLIRTTTGSNAINVDGVLNNLNITANCIDDANANPSGFAIQVGTHSSNGLITSNTITGYGANKVNNAGTNITAANNGP